MKYITSNANSKIPKETQLLIWYLLDSMDEDADYLQIFELSIVGANQRIRHYQEQPYWNEEIVLLTDYPITAKVYIITENGHATMMLAEDY